MNAPRIGRHAWLVSLYMFLGTQTMPPDTRRPWRRELCPIVSQTDFSKSFRWVTIEHGLMHTASWMGASFADGTRVLQRDWVADLEGRIIMDFVGRYEDGIQISLP
jgi:hypothetical protein